MRSRWGKGHRLDRRVPFFDFIVASGLEFLRYRRCFTQLWLRDTVVAYFFKARSVSDFFEGHQRLPFDCPPQFGPEYGKIYLLAGIGMLFAAISTRLDISFAVSRLARFNQNPNNFHHEAADRVIKYLCSTKNLWSNMVKTTQANPLYVPVTHRLPTTASIGRAPKDTLWSYSEGLLVGELTSKTQSQRQALKPSCWPYHKPQRKPYSWVDCSRPYLWNSMSHFGLDAIIGKPCDFSMSQ